MRICQTCNREYIPSSRHKVCPACQHQKRKTPCIDCGEPCGRNYKRCRSCSLKLKPARKSDPNLRRIDKKGYVYVQSDVPSKYIFEHRKTMEEYLGRKLLPTETVHHKNGKRDDNRLENLELWSSSQPSGQRIEDKLAWAYEIIELYS